MKTGNELRHIRRAIGMTPDEAAAEIGIHRGALDRIELGRVRAPHDGTVQRLSMLYRIPVARIWAICERDTKHRRGKQ